MRLRCNKCGSINIKTDPGDGTARCIHCHSEEIQVVLDTEVVDDLSNMVNSGLSDYEINYSHLHYR